MKKMKKLLSVVLVLSLAVTMLIGCGGPKTSPEDSAKIFLDVLLKDDKTNMDKIGMTEEDYTKFRSELESGMMEGFASTGLDESVITDEVKNQLKSDLLTGLSKLEYEVSTSTTEKDTAKVEVKIKPFDLTKVSTDAQKKLEADFTANPSMTQADIFKASFKYVGEGIAAGTVKDEAKPVTFTLTKESNVWLPGENDVVALMNVIVGM